MVFRVRRVRLGKELDWRYFAKRAPQYRHLIYLKRKNQDALKRLHERLVKRGVIRA